MFLQDSKLIIRHILGGKINSVLQVYVRYNGKYLFKSAKISFGSALCE